MQRDDREISVNTCEARSIELEEKSSDGSFNVDSTSTDLCWQRSRFRYGLRPHTESSILYLRPLEECETVLKEKYKRRGRTEVATSFWGFCLRERRLSILARDQNVYRYVQDHRLDLWC